MTERSWDDTSSIPPDARVLYMYCIPRCSRNLETGNARPPDFSPVSTSCFRREEHACVHCHQWCC